MAEVARADPDLGILIAAVPQNVPRVFVEPGKAPVRITEYTPVIAGQVLEHILSGKTWEQIGKIPGMPEYMTWLRWQVAVPELFHLNRVARKLSAQAIFDRVMGIGDKLESGSLTVADANALGKAAEVFKWAAAKLNPFDFGDKMPNTPAVAIQINTTLGLDPSQPVPEDHQSIYTLTATVPTVRAESDDDIVPGTKNLTVGVTKRGRAK